MRKRKSLVDNQPHFHYTPHLNDQWHFQVYQPQYLWPLIQRNQFLVGDFCLHMSICSIHQVNQSGRIEHTYLNSNLNPENNYNAVPSPHHNTALETADSAPQHSWLQSPHQTVLDQHSKPLVGFYLLIPIACLSGLFGLCY